MYARMNRAIRVLTLLLLVVPSAARAIGEDDPDVEIARRHFDKGARAYQAHDYANALGEFLEARRVKPLPAFDYNIGRCYDRLERYEEAVTFYERYLATHPGEPDQSEVTARVKVLKQRIGEKGSGAPPTPPPAAPVPEMHAPIAPAPPVLAPAAPTEPAPSPSTSREYLAPILVGVGAVAVLAAGTGLVVSVQGPYDDLKVNCPRPCPTDRYSGLEARADAGYALLGVGGVAAVADVVLFAVQRKRSKRAHAAFVLPSVGGLVAGGTF
jgi:tetratricopeptide (TPR) repeat protein